MHNPDCIFCKFAKGEIKPRIILEDDKHMAFLSHAPNTEGFSVVITKEHYPSYFADVPEGVRAGLINFTAKVTKLLDSSFDDVGRTGMFFEGFGVDHFHCKLFPMHGTKADNWEAKHSDVDKYFEKYEGYISSHDYGEPNRPEIDKTWEKIKQNAKKL